MTFSLAMYDSEMTEPPSFITGPNFCTHDTSEYAEADDAARYPRREVSIRGLVTSGPLASEWTRMSILPKSLPTLSATSEMVKPSRPAYRLLVFVSSGTSSG